MKENGLVEFRWHGRGGQGAKTACLLLADAAFSSGKFVQGFPEYGPERMGAPITAYNRISDTRCSIHCNIDCPDYVVVVDETLLDTVDVIINVADASALERSLYLTLQLLELGKPVVLALNMMDIVEKRGMEIDLPPDLRGDLGPELPQHPHAQRGGAGERCAGGREV